MAKKSVWIDNTTPPTNFIWVKTDEYGEIIGVYEYSNGEWVKIASGNNAEVSGDGVVVVTTLDGTETVIGYSEKAVPSTILVRTNSGVLKASTPTSESDLEDDTSVVTLEMLKWNNI